MMLLLLALAGGAGALLRFVADGLIRAKLGRTFPWGTIIVNVSGSLLLGAVTGLALHHQGLSQLKLILGTGFCGGYTTFSTASFETVRLIEARRYGIAFFHAFGGLGMCVVAAAIGLWLATL